MKLRGGTFSLCLCPSLAPRESAPARGCSPTSPLPEPSHCRGNLPDAAASPGAPRLPPPRAGCCLALGVPFSPLQPWALCGRESGRKRVGREGRTHRRHREHAGRHCRGYGGWRCATSPSRSAPFPLILPPPQPGLRFPLPDPQILAD